MTAFAQCPNPACGHVSHLADDPLGRIFRCPRCLTKLPTAPVTASDSGWTTVVRPGWARTSTSDRALVRARSVIDPGPLGLGVASVGSTTLESDEILVGPFALDRGRQETQQLYPELEREDSGEVFVGPLSHSGSSLVKGAIATFTSSSCAAITSQSMLRQSSADFGDGADLGRFRILGILGEGQHATVFRAYDPILDRPVAIKVPRQGVLSAKAVERFLGEAKALARLRHPRLVPVYEAGRFGQRYYIAMALIEGHSLAEELLEGPLMVHRGAEIVADLAEALAYAHAQGVVHRDVKPANIRVDAAGAVYLMDFGIAYRPDSGEVALPRGSILGTPAYIAPEQAEGGYADALPASDQYSLGVVLYELLCGRPPFCGPPSYVLFHAIHHEPPSPHTVVSNVPRSLAAVCLKALAKRPERRYSSCQQLADDLKRWLRSETPSAYRRAWPRLKI
jgi:eukaryotic-like serine/threonine-protein kinase